MCALECHKVSCSVWEAMDKEGNNFCVNLALASLPPQYFLKGAHTLPNFWFHVFDAHWIPVSQFQVYLSPGASSQQKPISLLSRGLDGWLMKKVQ